MGYVKVAHVGTTSMSLRYLVLGQLLSLGRKGYEVVGVSSPGPDVPYLEAKGIRHIAVPMTRRTFTPAKDLVAVVRLYRIFRRERFTIVHTHTPKAGFLGRLGAKLAGVPVIIHTNHGFVFHEGSGPRWRLFVVTLERLAAGWTDLIFSVNHEDIATAIREGICRPEKIAPLGDGGMGVDIAKFDPARVAAEEVALRRQEMGLSITTKVVGFVGRLVREKGLLELLAAAGMVVERVPGVRFLIIGPVDYAKQDAITPDVAREYGVADVCVFTGMRQDTPELYGLMDVFVLPSHREGFSLVLAEASAMGVPVIATNIRGCREAVEHRRNGLLVPPGDAEALADAIVHLLTHPDEARQMGQTGRAFAVDRFDERKVFERVASEYARLLRAKGQTAPESRPVLEV